MASEYIQYLIKDEKPAEAPPPLSPKERRKNWLYYHKWHLIIGAVLIVIALDLLRSALHIGEVEPDLQIAYVGTAVLTDDIIPALEALLSEHAGDANGDGRTVVTLNSYPLPADAPGDDTMAVLRNSSQVRLMADLEEGSSFLLLLEDPSAFEEAYHILAHPDGTAPEDEEDPILHPENYTVRWADVPFLAAAAEGGDLAAAAGGNADLIEYLNQLSFGRRVFLGDRGDSIPKENLTFWESLLPQS